MKHHAFQQLTLSVDAAEKFADPVTTRGLSVSASMIMSYCVILIEIENEAIYEIHISNKYTRMDKARKS